jgi:hypothetical protein
MLPTRTAGLFFDKYDLSSFWSVERCFFENKTVSEAVMPAKYVSYHALPDTVLYADAPLVLGTKHQLAPMVCGGSRES